MGNMQANDFLRLDQGDRQQVQQPLLNAPNNNGPNINPDNNIVHILSRQHRDSDNDNNNNDRVGSGYHSLSAAVNENKSDNRRTNITNAWNNYQHEMGNVIYYI